MSGRRRAPEIRWPCRRPALCPSSDTRSDPARLLIPAESNHGSHRFNRKPARRILQPRPRRIHQSRGQRSDSPCRPRRSLRLPRPQRRGEDFHDERPTGLRAAHQRHRPYLWRGRARAHRPPAHRLSAGADLLLQIPHRRGIAPLLRGHLRYSQAGNRGAHRRRAETR